MKSLSTREASRKLGISLISVQRYIAAKKITAPKVQKIGGMRFRLWTDRDIKRVRIQLSRNGRGKRTLQKVQEGSVSRRKPQPV